MKLLLEDVTVRAMPVTWPAAFNMDTMCRLTRDLVVKNPVRPDASPDYEALQGWPLVTALYNGIEQALKMLLLVPADPPFTLEALARRPYGHDLEKLYAELEPDDRDHIERHFQEHWSLHNYNPADVGTAEKFIAHINSGGRRGGMLSWRYILIEDISRVPSTSLWTMTEIWDAVCCRISREVLDKNGCSRLSWRLVGDFEDLVPVLAPYRGSSDDLNEWMAHRSGSILAAWIELLVKVNRGDLHEVRAPDRLRPELAKMAVKALKQMGSDSADPDGGQLLRRIKTEPNLAWDPTTGTFHAERSN